MGNHNTAGVISNLYADTAIGLLYIFKTKELGVVIDVFTT